MKKTILLLVFLLAGLSTNYAQKIHYDEFDLNNKLHVILHQDNTAPVVTVSMMYHIGSKDEEEGKTGMAHFFEHLLFTGTKNIPRDTWSDLVSSRGGKGNANTTWDRTYYYQTFPSNQLALALWMESERLKHPVIDQKAVDTQNEIVKEEKKQRLDNAPYGKILYGITYEHIFDTHTYKRPAIGYIKDLDAATLSDFEAFKEKWYVPSNAVLVIAGDFNKKEAKKLIEKYFGLIPSGKVQNRTPQKEPTQAHEKRVKEYDVNIQLPALLFNYKTAPMSHRDALVLDIISSVLGDGKSARLHKKMLGEDKKLIDLLVINRHLEDGSVFTVGGILSQDTSFDEVSTIMNQEISRLQNELVTDSELEKVRNKFQSQIVAENSDIEGIAENLATNYMLYDNTNRINELLSEVSSITKEEIRAVAKKYLNKNNNVIIEYLPKN